MARELKPSLRHARIVRRSQDIFDGLRNIGFNGEIQLSAASLFSPAVTALVNHTDGTEQFRLKWELPISWGVITVDVPDVTHTVALPGRNFTSEPFSYLRAALREGLAPVVWNRLHPNLQAARFSDGLESKCIHLYFSGWSLKVHTWSDSMWTHEISFLNMDGALFGRMLNEQLTHTLGRSVDEAVREFADALEDEVNRYLPRNSTPAA